jgi:hypothetical protein
MVTKLQTRQTGTQAQSREKMQEMFANTPLPANELMVNLPMYMRGSALAKLLYINELYGLIVDVPGVIMEFGTWWGANLVLFENLRAVYEPYNYTRRTIGFDTFKGYEGVGTKDGTDDLVFSGNYSVTDSYSDYLSELLGCHQNENPMGHLEKCELVEGDATKTIGPFMAQHPENIVALAYFDMQIYEPTKVCLEAIAPRLTKGSVIAMDELNCPEFPGETLAFLEVFGLRDVRLRKSRYLPDRTYVVIE